MNITQAIAAVASTQPQARAVVLGRNVLSYEELVAAVARLAGLLASKGVAPGDVVGIGMPTSPLHLLAILAVAHLGAASLPLAPGETAGDRRDIARRFGAKAVISDLAGGGVEGLAEIVPPRGWRGSAGALPAPVAAVDPGTPWRIGLSSGTTGRPKGFAHSHEHMLQFVEHWNTVAPQVGPGSCTLCFRGFDASFALRPALRQLLSGGSLAFAASTDAAAAIAALENHGVTHAVVSPPLLRSLCESAGAAASPRFPRMTHLAVGGTMLAPALARVAKARLTPNVYSHYGASEVGLIALADPGLLERRPDAAGRVAPWVEAQAVDDEGLPLPAGETGLLRFRGAGFIAAYLADPAASAGVFRGGWFIPGDVGRIDADRLLFIDGRADDRINLGGHKLDPELIERALEDHPQVAEAAVFAARSPEGKESLCAAIVVRGTLPRKELRRHCEERLGPRRTPERFFDLPQLPRNAGGKLLRGELLQAVKGRHGDASG